MWYKNIRVEKSRLGLLLCVWMRCMQFFVQIKFIFNFFKKLDKTLSECTIMIQKCKIPLQRHFWTKMCLLIDVVGYSYGATNYENTAVQFF